MKFRFGNTVVDTTTREITQKGKRPSKRSAHEVELFRLEFDLLCYLCANKGLALSRSQIIRDVWGADYTGTERSLDQCISQLRKKLGQDGKAIKTLYTLGYKFKP